MVLDIAVPGDSRILEKEREKVEKCQDLKRKVRRIWGIRKVDLLCLVHLEVYPENLRNTWTS